MEAKKDRFEDAAAQTTQVAKRKEFEGDLNFISDLDALDAALEADTIVCRFENPNGGDDTIDFELRPMTPGETAVYYNTLLGHSLFAAETGIRTGEIELNEEEADKLQDELAIKKYDQKLLDILESCIISHPGLTAERMRNWEPVYVMSLHNALISGGAPSKSVARFSTLDKTAG